VNGRYGILDNTCPLEPSHPLNDRIVNDWHVSPLAGWRGGALKDLVRGLHNPFDGAAVNSPTWVGGLRRGAYGALSYASGSSQYSNCGTPQSGQTFTALTIGGWMTRTATNVIGTFGWGDAVQSRFNILWYTDSNVYCQIERGIQSFPFYSLSGTGPNHFILTYAGTGTATLYVDGNKVTLGGTDASQSTYPVFGNFRIGTEQANSRYMSGQCDGVFIATRTFSAADARAFYDESRLGNPNRWRWVKGTAFLFPATAAPPATHVAYFTMGRGADNTPGILAIGKA